MDGTDPALPLTAGTVVATGSWKVGFTNVVPDATETRSGERVQHAPAGGLPVLHVPGQRRVEGEGSRFAWDDLFFGVYFDNTLYTEYCGFVPNDLLGRPGGVRGRAVFGERLRHHAQCRGLRSAVISVQEYWESGPRFFIAIEELSERPEQQGGRPRIRGRPRAARIGRMRSGVGRDAVAQRLSVGVQLGEDLRPGLRSGRSRGRGCSFSMQNCSTIGCARFRFTAAWPGRGGARSGSSGRRGRSW